MKFEESLYRTAIIAMRLGFAAVAFSFAASEAGALPADFTGRYQILQSRTLALTNGRGYVLQDGALITEANVKPDRAYCRSGQSVFDEVAGDVDVVFKTSTDGSERALLSTIPKTSAAKPTTLECVAISGFSGALDLSVALGRVFELRR